MQRQKTKIGLQVNMTVILLPENVTALGRVVTLIKYNMDQL